jgi:thioredoxin:protein disulfide reductase
MPLLKTSHYAPKICRILCTVILALSQYSMAAENDISSERLQTVFNTSSTIFANAQSQTADFLPANKAFPTTAWVAKETTTNSPALFINWQVAAGYYLYQHRFKFVQSSTASAQQTTISASMPSGKAKQDDYFGAVQVYDQPVTIALPADVVSAQQQLQISFQGCANAGLCYPPQTLYLQRHNQVVVLSSTAFENSPVTNLALTEPNIDLPLENSFTALLASAQLGSIIGLFFLAGLALTFTPCVLPMIPIISSIVLGQTNKPKRLRAFALSLTYVLAMAGTYALAGTLTGYFGASFNLQLHLQSPVVIISIALLFVAFALAMLGLYELRLPSALQNHLQHISQKQRGGTYIGVALIGMISTLIVSPCITAPLAGALVFISSTADPALGGTALLSLGLGMGLPLLLIGTFGSQLLPRSGQWMKQVKILFGILLLGLSIWMLERVLPAAITLALWVALLSGYALHLGLLKLFRRQPSISALPLFAMLLMLTNGLLIFNASQGNFNPFTPFKALSASPTKLSFKAVDNLQQLQQILTQQNHQQIVMLDLYADWCVSCQILEQQVFTAPEVSQQLQQLTLVRANITAGTEEHQALLKHFGLFGPPSLLFFNKQQELRSHRLQGEVSKQQLLRHLLTLTEKLQEESPQ